MSDLVVVELTKVLGIHFALVGIGHGGEAVQFNAVNTQILYGTDNVRKLAHTGGLDQDTVRRELSHHLLQGFAEVTHQRAADAALAHFSDLNAGILQEAAVNGDLAELILNEHQLLTLESLRNQFLNQCSLSGTQKSGENINLSHQLYSLPF